MNDRPASQTFGRRASPPDPHMRAPEPAPGPDAVGRQETSARAPVVDARRTHLEQRAAPRGRTLQSGRLLVDGATIIDCTIQDLSMAGAGIRIEPALRLPGAVRLLLISQGLLFDCAVVWRSGDRAGLHFSGRHDLRQATDATLDAARALWKDLRGS
jgi:hypothetical protein